MPLCGYSFFLWGARVCNHQGYAYSCGREDSGDTPDSIDEQNRNVPRKEAGRKKMAIVFVTVAPLGTATTSLSRYVAGVERILRDSGLSHQLTAMGTTVG